MQAGSLVTPSEMFFMRLPHYLNGMGAKFSPKTPEEGEIYVCKSLYNYIGIPCVEIEGLTVRSKEGRLHMTATNWVEVQPPMEVNIEELIEEPVMA